YRPSQPLGQVPGPRKYRDPLSAPEFVHARTEVGPGGKEQDLNNDPDHPDVKARVLKGGYDARHYVDFTADGWVGVEVGGLPDTPAVKGRPRPAYSLVTAPDFFPTCDQRELTEWTGSNAVPKSVKDIWELNPETLCDQRLPANLQTDGHPFDPDEAGITAL